MLIQEPYILNNKPIFAMEKSIVSDSQIFNAIIINNTNIHYQKIEKYTNLFCKAKVERLGK